MPKRVFESITSGIAAVTLGLALAACDTARTESEHHFVIGLVTNNPNGLRNVQGFQEGMVEFGYIEGENVTYIYEGEPISGNDLDAALERAELVRRADEDALDGGDPAELVVRCRERHERRPDRQRHA